MAPGEVSYPLALTWWAEQQVGPVGSERDWGSPCDSVLSLADAVAVEEMM